MAAIATIATVTAVTITGMKAGNSARTVDRVANMAAIATVTAVATAVPVQTAKRRLATGIDLRSATREWMISQ
jgi:hypothetical protein